MQSCRMQFGLLMLLAVLVVGLPSFASELPTAVSHCIVDEVCQAQGRLERVEIDAPGVGARLVTPLGCIALMMPPGDL